ncbi:uncharacterized protein [Macrobrachium rosenbergii]|uniref:uncharacterized protein n=1 Tax=Macrobrachium rosenbergii TaxID=79674 RepID=UPI0034D6F9D1
MSCLNFLRLRCFLCCIPLQKGCIIVGFFHMISSMFGIGKTVQQIVDFELSVIQCRRKDDFNTEPFISNKSAESDEDDENDNILHETDNKAQSPRHDACASDFLVSFVRVRLTIIALVLSVFFMVTVMMVLGVIRKKSRMMIPWMVWVIPEIFMDLANLLGLGFAPPRLNFDTLFTLVAFIYSTQVVTSYYWELKEAERRELGVTVVAVSRSPNEMMVVLPTGPKDDPPPPYPSFTSACNPAYNPTGIGYPGCAAMQSVDLSPPPEYTPNDSIQNAQNGNIPGQVSAPAYPDLNMPRDSLRFGEAAPLMEKPPLPNN